MGKIIEKGTEKVLEEFDKEQEGKALKAKFKSEGKQVKIEW